MSVPFEPNPDTARSLDVVAKAYKEQVIAGTKEKQEEWLTHLKLIDRILAHQGEP